MLQSQLKTNNQVIALVLFMLVNLTSCNCGNKNDQGSSSPKTSSDTNSGGTSTGTGTPPSTGTGGTNPVVINPPATSTATIPITPQEIDELLQALQDGSNPMAGTPCANQLKLFLETVKHNQPLNNTSQNKVYLLSAIIYKGSRYKDVLRVAIDKLKAVINDPYKNLSFLQHAAYYNNTDAIDLLILQGANKDFETTNLVGLRHPTDNKKVNDIDIPIDSTAYDIAAIFGNQEAMDKLK